MFANITSLEQVTIVADNCGNKYLRNKLRKTASLHGGFTNIKSFTQGDSRKQVLLQVSDLLAGVINRAWQSKVDGIELYKLLLAHQQKIIVYP
ncbi:DUF3800 domain-containing protein [bacterium]|nr:DUF3800 domain-containing protein [bacterium]